jgi:hypothetical protein
MTKPDLIKGQNYRVELYPETDVVQVRYCGQVNGLPALTESNHIFRVNAEVPKKGKLDGFLLVNAHWIDVKDEVISHKCISSMGVSYIPLDFENSDLIEKLNGLEK